MIDESGLLAVLLLVLFIGLKLSNIINWAWLWVMSPLWIPISLGILVLLSVAIFKITKLIIRINK